MHVSLQNQDYTRFGVGYGDEVDGDGGDVEMKGDYDRKDHTESHNVLKIMVCLAFLLRVIYFEEKRYFYEYTIIIIYFGVRNHFV